MNAIMGRVRSRDGARSPEHRTQIAQTARDLWQALLANGARLLRFVAVGAVAGLTQLALLVLLKETGLAAVPANVGAYLLSAQLNFMLSNRFIWHDRWSRTATARDLLRRWIAFHGSIAGTFVLSQAVFIGFRSILPDVIASALGIGVAAVANFLIQDRLTFQQVRAGGPRTVIPLPVPAHDPSQLPPRKSA